MANTLVIFGASGDLTRRKLIPALYRLCRKRNLPADTRIVGVSRTPFGTDRWRDELRESVQEFASAQYTPESWDRFANRLHYLTGDLSDVASCREVAQQLDTLEQQTATNRVYYLATKPALYHAAIGVLGASGLVSPPNGARRVIIEKPFGTDLASAQSLNQELHEVFAEDQVYRIDHYLGKESVQNLLVLRFANSIFEPLWNRNYVDHIQITVAEEVTLGRRAGYYDTAGVLRDMFQNHLLQLMMITAMEAPARYLPEFVRDEKVKVLQSVRPLTGPHVAAETIRGQYQGYRQEEGISPDSQTATFGVVKLHVDNWRWQGVPFYLRSGKGMSCRTTQIVTQFRNPPQHLFVQDQRFIPDANRLVIQIQPAEGIQLHFQTKVPEAGMRLRMTDLDFRFQDEFPEELPDAYQRLLLDALNGDASLFARSDEVELAWKIFDPIIAGWESGEGPPLEVYERGWWGPESSTEWMRGQGREWFDVCPVLSHHPPLG